MNQAKPPHHNATPLCQTRFNVQERLSGVSAESIAQSNTMFQNAQGVNISGNPNFQNIGSVTNVYGGRKDGLDHLNGFISFDAQFDSSSQDPNRRCHPGTRQNVLKRVQDWADDPNSTERICWLYGPAGAGKSAIAQTIAHSYNRPKVAATFFFFKSDVNRNDGNRLFTTLAYQLAYSFPAIHDHIANSLYERPDLPRAGIETQFSQLLALPFHALSDDATQQVGPAVIVDIIKKYRELSPIIIIDGIDECTDENLQQRLLQVIGDAVTDDRFPLRFLIVSRPEIHIEATILDFPTPIIEIDLSKLDDANRDIEKYLVDNFTRIASKQRLDPTWPGQQIIDDIVYKSSGNFIFASLVVKFVGDPYCYAKTQLDIVLNIKPPKTMSPFALLDQLYLEILKRVPDQDFLKRYLTLFTARISVPDGGDLHRDDAVIMHVTEEELYANLSRMRSLLKFEYGIDVHHKSFLDFLYDKARSGQYHIPEPSGGGRFLVLCIDSLIQDVSTSIELDDHYRTLHFPSAFKNMIKSIPPIFRLPTNIWQEAIRPLLDLQDNLLQLPKFASCTHPLCIVRNVTVFQLHRELLQIGLYHGIFDKDEPGNYAVVQSVMNLRKREGIVSLAKAKGKETAGDELDVLLLSLLSQLPEAIENWSPNKKVIKLVKDMLCFDYADTATRVRFVSDAQKLIDLLDYLIDEKDVLVRIHPEATRKATLLALKVFERVPVLPLASILKRNSEYHVSYDSRLVRLDECPAHIQELFETLFTNRIVNNRYVTPVVVDGDMPISEILRGDAKKQKINSLMEKWRSISNLYSMKINVVLKIANDIQYFHSMGIILNARFCTNDVYLDGKLCPKICCLRVLETLQRPQDLAFRLTSLERDIFCFGCILYELFSGINTNPGKQNVFEEEQRHIISERPEIPEYVWHLIQRCCAKDKKRRPTIEEVVKEINSWRKAIKFPDLEEPIEYMERSQMEKPMRERRIWMIKIGVLFLVSIAVVLYSIFTIEVI